MERKKLLVFHPALAPYRIDFFNYLDKSFDAIFYFSTGNVRNQKFDQAKIIEQCTFKSNILSNGFELGGRLIRTGIISLIKKISPEIILCSEYSQITLVVLFYKKFFRKNFKVYTYSIDNVDLSKKRKGIRKWVRSLAANNLDGIILTTPGMANWFHENVNKDLRILEAPTASENEKFRAKLLASLPLSRKIVESDNLLNKKVFLFVGRLVKVKNLEILVKSFAEINLKEKLLVIVGDGELKKTLQNLTIQLGLGDSVFFKGRLEGLELISWYNVAEYFVLPSYSETFGAVVNEALLGGCRVICSKLAGAAELINEKNGMLFDPYNQRELADKMEKAGRNMKGISIPLHLREDRMPFQLEDKFNDVVNNL